MFAKKYKGYSQNDGLPLRHTVMDTSSPENAAGERRQPGDPNVALDANRPSVFRRSHAENREILGRAPGYSAAFACGAVLFPSCW